MALTVRTNIASLSAISQLNRTQGSLTQSLERISSGLRVNRAADDAAGMSVANRMNSDNTSLSQAMRNTNDGISMIQTAEGGANEVYNILTRMRELAVQSSNQTYSSTDRNQMSIEFNALRKEIKRMTTTANFNSISVLNSTKTLSFQIGIHNNVDNRFTGNLASVNLSIGALAISTGSVSLGGATTLVSSANSAITAIDTALVSVNNARAHLGAFQNRLESTLNAASNYSQNLAATASRITDVDYAEESSNMTRYQIQLQASVAALGQAKAIPQSVVSLLS
jgi:flagellin